MRARSFALSDLDQPRGDGPDLSLQPRFDETTKSDVTLPFQRRVAPEVELAPEIEI